MKNLFTNFDWQMIILNLRNAGLTYRDISKRIGMDAQTVGHLARQEIYEPKFSKGLALLNLHYDLCPEKHNRIDLKP